MTLHVERLSVDNAGESVLVIQALISKIRAILHLQSEWLCIVVDSR